MSARNALQRCDSIASVRGRGIVGRRQLVTRARWLRRGYRSRGASGDGTQHVVTLNAGLNAGACNGYKADYRCAHGDENCIPTPSQSKLILHESNHVNFANTAPPTHQQTRSAPSGANPQQAPEHEAAVSNVPALTHQALTENAAKCPPLQTLQELLKEAAEATLREVRLRMA